MKTCIVLFAALVLAGCASTGPNAQRGTAAGAPIGAIIGGIIGHQSGEGLEGATIGGALGAIGGALIGSAEDDLNPPASRRRGSY